MATITFSVPHQHQEVQEAHPPPALGVIRSHAEYELTLRGVAASGLLPGVVGGTSVVGAFGSNGVRWTLALTYLPESKRRGVAYGSTAVSSGLCADAVRSPSLTTSLCGEFALGAIHTVVYDLVPLRPGDQWTAAAAVGPQVGWHRWAPLFVELGVSAWVGLLRPRFSVVSADSTRSTTDFQSRLVSGTGFIGMGVATP